jgi:hypothetical protein
MVTKISYELTISVSRVVTYTLKTTRWHIPEDHNSNFYRRKNFRLYVEGYWLNNDEDNVDVSDHYDDHNQKYLQKCQVGLCETRLAKSKFFFFRADAMLLFYIIQRITIPKFSIFRKSITIQHCMALLQVGLVSIPTHKFVLPPCWYYQL